MIRNKCRLRSIVGTSIGVMAIGVGLSAESATASYLSEIASQTPMLYWEMNETVLTSPMPAAIDNMDALFGVGNFANGAVVGPDIVLGVPGPDAVNGFPGFAAGNTAYNFNTSGAGSVVTTLVQPEAGTPHGMDAGSISMWFNATDPNLADPTLSGVLWRADEGGGNLMNLRVIDVGGQGTVNLNLEAGEVITIANGTDGTIDYSDGAWHHVAATWSYNIGTDVGILNLYVDGGTLAGGETVSAAFNSTSYAPILQESDPLGNPGVFDEVMNFDFRSRIGKGRNNARRYNGDIDAAAIWDRTLTAQEAADQYNAAIPEPTSLMLLAGAIGCVSLRRSKK